MSATVGEVILLLEMALEKLRQAAPEGQTTSAGKPLAVIEGASKAAPRGPVVPFGKYRGYGVIDIAYVDRWYIENVIAQMGYDESGALKADDEYAESNAQWRTRAAKLLEMYDPATGAFVPDPAWVAAQTRAVPEEAPPAVPAEGDPEIPF